MLKTRAFFHVLSVVMTKIHFTTQCIHNAYQTCLLYQDALNRKYRVIGDSFLRMLQMVVDAHICALDTGSAESMKCMELWLHDMESSPTSESSQRIPSIFTVYK